MTPKAIKYLPRLVAVLALGSLGGVVYFLFVPGREGTAVFSADAEISVRIAQVRAVSLPGIRKFAGELLPVADIEIVSRLAGKVGEVRFKAGDWVPAGAIVATVRATGLDQRIAALEANVSVAKQDLRPREDDLVQAEKRLAQDREFFRRDLIARRDVEQTETAVETVRAQAELARAQLAQQEAMLAQVRALQSLTRLSAPVGGEVSKRWVEPGAAVGEGTAIIAIATLDRLKLKARVTGAAAPGLRPGVWVQITTPALPGLISEGKIIRVEPQRGGEGRMDEIEIEVSNPQKKLRPRMAVEASIELATDEEILLVPRSSIAAENQFHYVYKIAGGRAVRQQVVIGLERGDEVTIVGGLKAGESIVADLKKVKSGARIRPR